MLRGGALVVVRQPAHDRDGADRSRGGARPRGAHLVGDLLAEALVRPLAVVVRDPPAHVGPQVVLAEHDQVREELAACGADEALREGVRHGRARRGPEDLRAAALEHGVEARAELASKRGPNLPSRSRIR